MGLHRGLTRAQHCACPLKEKFKAEEVNPKLTSWHAQFPFSSHGQEPEAERTTGSESDGNTFHCSDLLGRLTVQR